MVERKEIDRQPSRTDLTDLLDLDLCNSCSATAASPRGSLERPLSMSLTDDCVSPMAVPISATVIPFRRRSEMREDHVVMAPSIRNPDILCNRHSATVFRNNGDMGRPADLPSFDAVGPRVRWWRKHRGLTQPQLAAKAGLGQSTLSGLENEKQISSTKINKLATALGIDPTYLETDEGDPQPGQNKGGGAAAVPEQRSTANWPFKRINRMEIERLNEVEQTYAETILAEALAVIAASRRKKGSG